MKMNHSSPQRKHKQLFLLDGMALIYRAYYSFKSHPLVNSKGENTGAIFGFVNTLMKILNEEKPDYIAVVFDTKEPTFRHKMYHLYKATRQKMPEDLVPQIEKVKEVVRAFNINSIELNGYEADDIMGTLARKGELLNIETFLVTGDKDFMQLITPYIKIFKPGKKTDDWNIIDEKNVTEKFGVKPQYVTDVLGLIGDKSDNIPGVIGIGDKIATSLVQQFGTIENIYDNIDKIKQNSLKEKLQQHKSEALLSKKLVTINTEVPINIDLQQLATKPYNTYELIRLFSELEFSSLLRKLKSAKINDDATEFDVSKLETSDISTDEHTYHIITTEEEFEELATLLENSKMFVFDTETTSKSPFRADLLGISFAVKPKEAWYIPILLSHEPIADNLKQEKIVNKQSDLFSADTNLKTATSSFQFKAPHPKSQIPNRVGFPLSFILKRLSPIFSNPLIKKIGQNIKYDILILSLHGVKVEGVFFDTMVANYLLRSDGAHNLNALAKEHLNYKMISYDDLVGKGKEKKNIQDIPIEKVAEYSNQDADITFRLYEILKEKIERHNLTKLAEEVEFPLINVLADMELTGVKLDVPLLSEISRELQRILNNLTNDIYNSAGEKFNINSSQQLRLILFNKLKLTPKRKTKTGFSTDIGVLETLRNEHPIIEKLLEYRQIQKLKTTYVDALPSLINPKTGRVHTSFNQTITVTGRLSSSEPNFQNIPIRTDIGSQIRKAFIPNSPEMLILSADYSQIELRIMAHISADEGLIAAFKNREDIHVTTASKVFGVNPSELTKDMRRKAKEVNFGIMYGIGPKGLAARLDISVSEAKEIISKYFDRFPKVKQYIFDTINQAKHNGYASTLLGRRRYLPDINSQNHNIRSNAERQAINMPIQGTAADMIKIAMINIHKKIPDSGLKIMMVLQVHDELVFEGAENQLNSIKNFIAQEMINALPLSVPIEVKIGAGKNWLQAY